MGSILAAAFREQVKKTKDIAQITEMQESISYPTGLLPLDMANGYIYEVNGNKYPQLGITDGSINMLISDSGLGKTTMATQIACNIVKRFPTSVVFYEEAESVGTSKSRIRSLSGMSKDEFEDKFIIRDAGITTESIYERVKMIYNIKINDKDRFIYDTGIVDYNNKPIYKFEPTIVIVDSVKLVLSRKAAEADETTNMAGAQTAKVNSEYYTKMVPMCRLANIIMILINHITTDIAAGPFVKKPSLAYLKVGESISGGRSLAYIQNNIFRLDLKTKLKETDPMGIIGSVVSVDIVKSRTSKSARSRCNLIFDPDIGFDNDLSLLYLMKEENLLSGSGAYLKVPGCDIKFSQKQFKKLIQSNPEFRTAVSKTCFKYLYGIMLEEHNRIKSEVNKLSGSVGDDILNMLKNPTDIMNEIEINNETNNSINMEEEDDDDLLSMIKS